MLEAELLEIIVLDLDSPLKKIVEIEENVEDINIDLNQVKPGYLKRLKAIKREGTISSAEFEKKLGVKI